MIVDLEYSAVHQQCLMPTESVLTAGLSTVHVHAVFQFDLCEIIAFACQLQVECLCPVMQVQFAAASICKRSWNIQTDALNTDDAPVEFHSAVERILTSHYLHLEGTVPVSYTHLTLPTKRIV